MRILMLGWEFPPFIAGGLGTACYGLTKALDRLGHEVVFVLPKPVDRSAASHIRLLSPEQIRGLNWAAPKGANGSHVGAAGGLSEEAAANAALVGAEAYTMAGFTNVSFRSVPAPFTSTYPKFHKGHAKGGMYGLTGPLDADVDEAQGDLPQHVVHEIHPEEAIRRAMEHEHGISLRVPEGGGGNAGAGYEGDMIANAERYARLVVTITRGERFDVIHAHDWMTFPAGIALAAVSGKPLVVHVHSTEFDRSGDNINQRVYDIERRGMHAAMRAVCVSNLTQSICVRRYGVDPKKTDVVYNGIENDHVQPHAGDMIASKDKIVLFLGRITMQKGPEYFIRSAKRVLEKVQDVKFVVAGSGDMAVRMIEEAAHLGIGHKVLFTGFLRGKDVDRVFRMADVYVMPSVSEPFGIAPLEAMRNDVPVIISKQSGVSEVLTHALKVDFWDIDEMANKIVAVLRHPPLGQTLAEHGAFELRRLTWDGAAEKCVESYGKAIGGLVGV
ncbi:MAG: glycosyltransferase [Phycisphaerales bacterium]|nr:glycosyltransferase [Phycisphaerales bacterium]